MTGRGGVVVRRLVRRHPGLTLIAIPYAMLALVVGLIWFPGGTSRAGAGGSVSAAGVTVPQNRPAPNFNLPRLFGSGRLSLQSLRGEVVVLNFWASWCTVCKHEVPALQQLSGYYAGKHVGVDIVGVDHGDRSSSGRGFAQRNGMAYPSVVDGSGSLLREYGAAGMPSTYVIGRDGRIRFQVMGAVDPTALRRCIDRLLANEPTGGAAA